MLTPTAHHWDLMKSISQIHSTLTRQAEETQIQPGFQVPESKFLMHRKVSLKSSIYLSLLFAGLCSSKDCSVLHPTYTPVCSSKTLLSLLPPLASISSFLTQALNFPETSTATVYKHWRETLTLSILWSSNFSLYSLLWLYMRKPRNRANQESCP